LEAAAVELTIPQGIFPLPLTAFETFMIADAKPGYSMWCDCELQFSGEIERHAFDQALRFALDRNPLLHSLVVASGAAASWTPVDRLPIVDWGAMGEPLDDCYDSHIDLGVDIGLRMHVRQGEDRSTVLIQFHHACSDGVGIVGFIEDFLYGYAKAQCEQ